MLACLVLQQWRDLEGPLCPSTPPPLVNPRAGWTLCSECGKRLVPRFVSTADCRISERKSVLLAGLWAPCVAQGWPGALSC